MRPTEPGGIQIFRAQLSWADVPGCFSEANSARSWAYLGSTARALKFVVPPITRTPGLLKLSIDPQPRAVQVCSLRFFGHDGKLLWECVPNSTIAQAAEPGFHQRKDDAPLLQIGDTVLELSPDMKQIAPFTGGGTLEVGVTCEGHAIVPPETDGAGADRGGSSAKLRRVEQEFAVVSQALNAVTSSKSWRWTEPLRDFLTAAKHARDVARNVELSMKKKFWLPLASKPTALRDVGVIDVIVPIYRGLLETKNCLESVIENKNRTPFELIVINDCSPEPDLVAYVRDLAGQGAFTLIEHEQNLGYTQSVNGGIALHPDRDVVLLNSDTEVSSDWLDRLVAAAYSAHNIATVTPFSNNATLCSYPRPYAQNDIPDGWTRQSIDGLMKELNHQRYIPIPTAVGFCMYIRRESLNKIGVFDAESFPGYGEENDFCMRVVAAGWSNLLAADTFVRHVGTVSFGGQGRARQKSAWNMVKRLYPDYENLVARHAAQDPSKSCRDVISVARMRQSAKPKVLFLVPDLHGGTERHVKDLAKHLSSQCECLLVSPAKESWRLDWLNQGEWLKLSYPLNDAGFRDLVGFLKSVPIERAHVHHAQGTAKRIKKLVDELGVPFDFTVHDFFTVCPQTFLADETHQFCGQPDRDGCNRCIAANCQPVQSIDVWREDNMWLVRNSERIFVPSRDTAERLKKYWPDAHLIVVPHLDQNSLGGYPQPRARTVSDDEPLRIAVLGALSQEKGADVLEECAIQCAELALPLEFHLIGYAYHTLTPRPGANLVVNGAYYDKELQSILSQVRPHIVWFPARIPETFSYTLSAALESGLPVIAGDLGAFAERLDGRHWSWVVPWSTAAGDLNRLFVQMREAHFKTGIGPTPPSGHEPAYDEFSYWTDYLAPLRKKSEAASTTSGARGGAGASVVRAESVEELVKSQ